MYVKRNKDGTRYNVFNLSKNGIACLLLLFSSGTKFVYILPFPDPSLPGILVGIFDLVYFKLPSKAKSVNCDD